MKTTLMQRTFLLSLGLIFSALIRSNQSLAQDGATTVQNVPAMTNSAGMSEKPQTGTDAGAESKKTEETKIKPGVVASYGKFDKRVAVDGAANGNIAGEQQSPVSGSVKFLGSDRCKATVSNLSDKDSYSVSFDVVGSRGSSKSFTRGFSATLKPKESVSRNISGCSSDLNVQVVLKSGRKVGK